MARPAIAWRVSYCNLLLQLAPNFRPLAPQNFIRESSGPRCGRSPRQGRWVFLGLGAERGPRIVDQGGEDVTQQIALRDDHIGTVFDRSRDKLVLGHERRPELIEIAVEPPMAPRPDLMPRSVPGPTALN